MLHGLSHFMACQGHQRFLLSLEPFVCNTLKSAVILKKSGTELTDEASSVIFLITLNMKQWNQILNNTTFCSVPCTVFSWDFPPKATVWHGIAYEMLLLTGWSFHNIHVSWLHKRPQWGDKAQNSLLRTICGSSWPRRRSLWGHFKTLKYSEML